MRIAALQMVSTPDVDRNLDAAARLVAEAARAGARLVALPEWFCLMARHDADKLAVAEAPGDGPIQRRLADTARAHGVWLVGGSLPLRIDDEPARVHNACCVYAPDGSLAARYDKVHLFRYEGRNESFDEARVLRAGARPVVFDADGVRVGLSICYDLRFPEFYRALMRDAPCDLLCVPSAFTHTTGAAHWETLLRARAIENQCYVIAPAQGGLHETGRRTWGHTLVVDPWGAVLGCRDEGEGVVVADLDGARIASVRRQLPALEHRRL
jgi:predicted amidohydrolase